MRVTSIRLNHNTADWYYNAVFFPHSTVRRANAIVLVTSEPQWSGCIFDRLSFRWSLLSDRVNRPEDIEQRKRKRGLALSRQPPSIGDVSSVQICVPSSAGYVAGGHESRLHVIGARWRDVDRGWVAALLGEATEVDRDREWREEMCMWTTMRRSWNV